MESLSSILGAWWWVIPILVLLVMYKWTLRFVFGMVIIPDNHIGLKTKVFTNPFVKSKELPDGRIIALNGEAGLQVHTLPTGLYWGYYPWHYKIKEQPFLVVPKGQIGLISAKDGASLPVGQILARSVECNNFQDARAFITNGGQKGKQVRYLTTGTYVINTLLFDFELRDIVTIAQGDVGIITALEGAPLSANQIAGNPVANHNNFQDFDAFLANGGQKGLQVQTILSGTYTLNPWAVKYETTKMFEVPIGYVGIVISYVGEEGTDISGTDFKHGNIVNKGQKGVWSTPLDPGRYPINPFTHKTENVPTTNLVLNWANARSEAHNLDKHLSTITVRSKDGFQYNLDVSQIIHIPSTEAPKVIARFGSVQNLVSQVLEPTIGTYFRNSAQDSDVITFLGARQERQQAAKDCIAGVLQEYNVHAVDTLIGDINPPAELMKTLTDRKIAEEEEKTYETQMAAQKIKQKFESEKALANMQGQIVAAQQSVLIAERTADATIKTTEGEAKSITLKAEADAKATKLQAEAEAYRITETGKAEGSKILEIGNATAEAYQKQVTAMGAENFAKFKITESIGENGIKIIPEILINGNGGSAIDGLVATQLMSYIGGKTDATPTNGSDKRLLTEGK
jgi:uncharacterized membrane protein YqiK